MLGSLGISLRDVDDFAVRHPNGLFAHDVDMLSLFRKTPLAETVGQAHEDIRRAANDTAGPRQAMAR